MTALVRTSVRCVSWLVTERISPGYAQSRGEAELLLVVAAVVVLLLVPVEVEEVSVVIQVVVVFVDVAAARRIVDHTRW